MKNEIVETLKGICVCAWLTGWFFTIGVLAGLGVKDTGIGLLLSALAIPGWPVMLGIIVGQVIRHGLGVEIWQ